MSLRIAAPSLAIAAVLACAGDPTHPSPLSPPSTLAAAITAADAPNVWRYQAQFIFGIQDPVTDLFAIAGLPDHPFQALDCGGSEPYAIADFQESGVQQDVIHALVKGSDVNLDVYQRSTFSGFCTSLPIAHGTGRMMYNDNDAYVTGSGSNAWGYKMEGQVELVSGGSASLMAHNRFQILPDGSFRRIFRMVRLSAQ